MVQSSKERDKISIHVLQLIAEKIGPTPSLLRIAATSSQSHQIIRRQFASFHKGLILDLADYNETNILLSPKWYEDKKQSKEFHNDVRAIINLLMSFSEYFETDCNTIRNVSPHAIAWNYPQIESSIKRCPAPLQKKIVALFREKFRGTTEFVYHPSLLRPTRFIRTFSDRLKMITKLDLGEMRAIKAVELRSNIFPELENLEELVWHSADMWFVETLPHPHKLKKLCITLNIKGSYAESLHALMNCQGLTHLHTGITRPPINRLVWHVVLKNYQAFWNQKRYSPDNLLQNKGLKPVPLLPETENDYTIRAFPNIKNLSFWDTPEYLFTTMNKLGIRLNELQLGLLSQDLQRLCSLDSIMQAFFKFLQPDTISPLHINHLKINAHSMPVVNLDYYLPNLMLSIQRALPEVETLEIFIHCLIQGACMPSSWILDKERPKRPKSLFENLTKFSFHIDGYCLLDNLDTYLPETVKSITLSFIQPKEHRKKFLDSLVQFIKYLGDINRFPELDELAIQVWGVNCFEPIANAVIDHLTSLKKLSIIALPVNKEKSKVKYTIEYLAEKCTKLEELGIASEMISFLMEQEEKRSHWRDVLFQLREQCNIESDCVLAIKRYPELAGWNQLIIKPVIQIEELEEDNEAETEEESCAADSYEEEDDDYDEDDSFIAKDEDEEEFTDDELDHAEKVLESEDEVSHRRWVKKRARIESDDSVEESDDENVIIFKSNGDCSREHLYCDDDEEESERNPFIDDEAEEVSGESVEDETEPEGEDTNQTDDEDLFEAQIERINIRPRRHPPPPMRKRRIIESDSE